MDQPYLTMAEIEAKYPSEWVLIDRPKYRKKWQDLQGGVVAWHSTDHEEFLRRLEDFPEVGDCAIRYTGVEQLDPDEVLILNHDL